MGRFFPTRRPGSKLLGLCGLVLLVTLLTAPAASAETARTPAGEFILRGVARSVEILRAYQRPRAEILEMIRRELREGFDLPAIAARVLGAHYARMSDPLRETFLREFEDLIVETLTGRVLLAGPQISRDLDDIVKIVGETPMGDRQTLVRSRINRTGANWVNIDWLVREREGRIAIVDLSILGISQAEVYRAEFASIIRRGGVEGLIETLRQKNAVLRAP